MDFLASLPAWAVLAVVAALSAAIGIGIAWTFRDRFRTGSRAPVLMTAVAVIIGVGLGNSVLVRAIERTPAGRCEVTTAAAEEFNANIAGTAVDALTNAGAMNVDCEAKAITVAFTISEPRSAFGDAGVDGIRRNFNASQCSNAAWRAFIDDGWRMTNIYTFADGATETVTADCTIDAAPAPPAIP